MDIKSSRNKINVLKTSLILIRSVKRAVFVLASTTPFPVIFPIGRLATDDPLLKPVRSGKKQPQGVGPGRMSGLPVLEFRK